MSLIPIEFCRTISVGECIWRLRWSTTRSWLPLLFRLLIFFWYSAQSNMTNPIHNYHYFWKIITYMQQKWPTTKKIITIECIWEPLFPQSHEAKHTNLPEIYIVFDEKSIKSSKLNLRKINLRHKRIERFVTKESYRRKSRVTSVILKKIVNIV